MYDKMKKIEDIERLTIFKMIHALLQYDYFSTKCLINELLHKRGEEQEINILKHMQKLLFEQKIEELNYLLIRLIQEEKGKK